MTRPGRPRRGTEVPAAAIEAAYRDLDTTLAVSAERLGIHGCVLTQRARHMGLPGRARQRIADRAGRVPADRGV